ncbi:MAG: hypothetical protein H6581_18775 [Bacteroidia bacterium]|nr:hypothetical protein [Bacteroidia bacterium]
MNYFQFNLLSFSEPGAEPKLEEFTPEEFARARDLFQRLRHQHFLKTRSGDALNGYYPYSQLRLVELTEDNIVVEERLVASDQLEMNEFAVADPLTERLVEARLEGMEWFVQDEDGDRSFFESEDEAIAHAVSNPEVRLQLYNLDRYLDLVEERNLRFFLQNRPAISTNMLESLCKMGRGTLSKIKNAQRQMNRKQYKRAMNVLPFYGYQPHVDLRDLTKKAP